MTPKGVRGRVAAHLARERHAPTVQTMNVRQLGFLGAAVAIAACTSLDQSPERRAASGQPVDAAATAVATPWQTSMQQVKLHMQIVRDQLQDSALADLPAVAAAANAAADLLRDGYGRCEDHRVPEFARMARDAESWCLQIASEARLAHGAIARELFVSGIHHCSRCHDAVEKLPG